MIKDKPPVETLCNAAGVTARPLAHKLNESSLTWEPMTVIDFLVSFRDWVRDTYTDMNDSYIAFLETVRTTTAQAEAEWRASSHLAPSGALDQWIGAQFYIANNETALNEMARLAARANRFGIDTAGDFDFNDALTVRVWEAYLGLDADHAAHWRASGFTLADLKAWSPILARVAWHEGRGPLPGARTNQRP